VFEKATLVLSALTILTMNYVACRSGRTIIAVQILIGTAGETPVCQLITVAVPGTTGIPTTAALTIIRSVAVTISTGILTYECADLMAATTVLSDLTTTLGLVVVSRGTMAVTAVSMNVGHR
jgi:hypothetical protein